MKWEADLISGLQQASNSLSDAFFKTVTLLGDELLFMAVAFFFFWCISKRDGFKFINVYFVGCAVVECSKLLIRRARPFNAYDGYVHSIGEKSSSYSLPSGHSHSIANISTQITLKYRNNKNYLKVILPVVICVTLLVIISRLFLGQHYLTDVIAGVALGIGVAIGASILFELLKDKEEWIMLGVIPLCIILTIVIMFVTEDADTKEKILAVTGAYIAVAAGYFVEKRYVKFNVKASWKKNILKLLLGGGVAMGLHIGLRYICKPEQSIFVYSFLRYFIVAAWAMVGAPFVFKKLKLFDDIKPEDKITETSAITQENT